MLYYCVDEAERLAGFAVCFTTLDTDFEVSGDHHSQSLF